MSIKKLDEIKDDIVLQYLCHHILPTNRLLDASIEERKFIKPGEPSTVITLVLLINEKEKRIFQYNYKKIKRNLEKHLD